MALNPQHQSPIDLGKAKPVSVRFPPHYLELDWTSGIQGTPNPKLGEFVFDGAKPGGVILNGESFPLLKFHFHQRSEHKVNGRDWPFEVHFVHGLTTDGPYVVLGIFVTEGKGEPDANDFFLKLTEQFESQRDNPITINPRHLLPRDQKNYYRYEGSLTTKLQEPNSENVSWVIYQNPIEVNPDTVRRFIKLIHKAKPVQEPTRRFVLFNTD